MLRLARPLLAAGLAAGLLTTIATLPAPAQDLPMRLAQAGPPAQDDAPVDVNVFYDQLGRYGTWVEHPDYQYVFIPSDVGPEWRPYQEGRWVWTEQYGWYWESYEPFGWATYHYGRWGYDPSYGWFWVPGDTWAPAWVTWRKGGGRTGWAPIAPDRPGYALGPANDYAPPVAESWVFVEDRYMAEEDVGLYVAPIPEINVYLEAAPDYYEPSWNDGYYVNRGFGYNVYDRPIRERLYSREVVYVDRGDDVFYNGGRLGIFAPPVAFHDRVRPPRFERRLDPGRRALIRQYVRDDRDLRGPFVPSAALLNAVEPDRRRELREARFNDPERYRRELQQVQRQRAERVNELRRQADAQSAALEQQRRQALEQRRAMAERVREQQRARAQRVLSRPDARPGTRPAAAPGMRPGGSPSAAQRQQQAVEAQRRAAEQQRALQQQRLQQQQQMQQQRAAQQEAQQRAQQQRAVQQQQMQQQRAQQQRAAQQEAQQRAQQQRAVQQQMQQQRAQQQRGAQQPPPQQRRQAPNAQQQGNPNALPPGPQ